MKQDIFSPLYYKPHYQGNHILRQNNLDLKSLVKWASILPKDDFNELNAPKINVAHFQRHQNNSLRSIEFVFNEIRKTLPYSIMVTVQELPYKSKGLINRIQNIMRARNETSLINHITADIHYLALGLPGKNTILTVHDLGFMKQYKFIKRFLLWLFWIYLPVKKVKKVVAISQATKNQILKYTKCNPNKIEVISNFLPSNFVACPKEFNVQKPVILQIGTKFNKNIERLVEALDGLSCKLIIIGELQKKHLLLLNKYKIEYENRVNLSEHEIIDTYRECDLLSFCSVLEGFGLPILEAQATGRPVVTSNIYSMPEVAGNGACLVDPFDVQSIRNGLERVIFNYTYRCSLISNGYENIKRYSIESVARQYTELYCELYVSLI